MAIQDIKYNNHSFQTIADPAATILTRDIRYKSIGEKTIIRKEDTIRDGWDFIDERYSHKIITISGWLISNSATNLRTLINNVKGYLKPPEKNLDIETYGGSGSYIRYEKTVVQSFRIEEEFWQVTQVPFTCEFFCSPFGKETTSDTSNSWSNITSNTTKTFSITGTYNAKPIITMTVNSETNMSKFKLTNTSTQDWIQVETAFNGGDVLVLNSIDETVELNSTAQDFSGVFLDLCPEISNNLKIEVTADAFDIDLAVEYWPTYL